jgi:phosphatidylethanolamine/phosphatidyl-N-methylethanolamine N-methyltransferase
MDQQAVQRVYRRYAPLYDIVFGSLLQHGRRQLGRTLRALPGQRVLEIGVGTGLLLPLYPDGVSVVGIDISAEMLAVARRRAERLGLERVELYLMDAERTTFPDGTFDHVVIPYVYSVTPNPHGLIREARRVCKAGGDIYLLNHFSGNGVWWRWGEALLRPFASRIGFRSDFSIETYVNSMNWNIVNIQPVNLLGLSRLVHFKNTDSN